MPSKSVAMLMMAVGMTMLAGAVSAAEQARSARDGIYSAAQADRGAAHYAEHCARCHGAELLGSYDVPSLRGALIARWANAPIGDLFAYISHAMPMQAPGALGPAVNVDILAFILRTDGYPAGAKDLVPDGEAMKAIRLVGASQPWTRAADIPTR